MLMQFAPSIQSPLHTSANAEQQWQQVLAQDFEGAVNLLSLQWAQALEQEESLKVLQKAETEALVKKLTEPSFGHVIEQPEGLRWVDMLNHVHIEDHY
jgi:hypothetical protein